MRPLLRRVLSPETPLALPPSAAMPGTGHPVPHAQAQAHPHGEPPPPPGQLAVFGQAQAPGLAGDAGGPVPPGGVPAWVSNARSLGEAQAQTVKSVGSLVSENPKQAALIVRDWLGNAA
jgi:flagellar M-ring protein FliF